MKRHFALAFALTSSLISLGSAFAQTPAVRVQDAFSRATPPHATTGAVYMTLTSQSDDRLMGVASSVADKAQVHEMQMDENVMRMREVEGGLALPAGKPVMLKPGSYHIMLEGLKEPLKQGQTVPLHLTFQHAPTLDIMVDVRSMRDTAPASHSNMSTPGMNMGK